MYSTAETAEASPDTGDDGKLGSRPGVLASVVIDYLGMVLLDFLA